MHLAILHSSALAPDPGLLTHAERAVLATVHGTRRRDEWIRGRLAMRRVLADARTSVLADPDGAPRAVGGSPVNLSLSHDGDWLAVAVAGPTTRVGIDLCLRSHADRVARILRWLAVRGASRVEGVAVWAALEAALKLRRWSVEMLRDRAIEIERESRSVIVVRGLGEPVTARIHDRAELVVGCATEAV